MQQIVELKKITNDTQISRSWFNVGCSISNNWWNMKMCGLLLSLVMSCILASVKHSTSSNTAKVQKNYTNRIVPSSQQRSDWPCNHPSRPAVGWVHKDTFKHLSEVRLCVSSKAWCKFTGCIGLKSKASLTFAPTLRVSLN